MMKLVFWKDKQGNELTFKQFMSKWKTGIENITPVQKLKTQMNGTMITIIGLIAGLSISLINIKTLWWLSIILVGGIITTGMQYISYYQQYKVLKNIECMMNDVNGGVKWD